MRVKRPKILEAVRQDDVEAEFVGSHRTRRECDLRAARLLAQIADSYHYAYRGCASIAQFGEMHGLSARETRVLVAVGRVLAHRPELEEKILSGRLSLEAVAALGKVFENPAMVRDGEDWLLLAEGLTTRELERRIRKRLVELESGEPASEMTAVLSASGREKFERARVLACRKEGKALSEGQTVEVLSDHYLASFDPKRKKPRKRRMTNTTGRSGRRVPADVDREVMARHDGRCPVPGCDHALFMEKAHLVAHRNGGSREADNLIHVCSVHHVLVDAGLLTLEGTLDAPRFRTADGHLLCARAPPQARRP